MVHFASRNNRQTDRQTLLRGDVNGITQLLFALDYVEKASLQGVNLQRSILQSFRDRVYGIR